MSTQGRRRAELEAALDSEKRIQVFSTVVHMQAIASRVGINITDVQCLNLLTLQGPQTPGRLAEALAISKGGAVTAMIDRLEKAGYVRRTRDPNDRRQVLVEVLADEPLRRLTTYFQPFSDVMVKVLTHYDDEQVALIANYTARCNAEIQRLNPGQPAP